MAGIYRLLTWLGRVTVPLGLFAVIAVGIHAGADRIDDHALVALSVVDAWVDDLGTTTLRWLLGAFGAGLDTISTWTFAFADFVDLETKDWIARALALVVELVADVTLAIPIFWKRRRELAWRQLVQNLIDDPTVLRVVAPLSAALAAWAGGLVIARELQVMSYAAFESARGLSEYAGQGARVIAGVVLVLVAWRLAVRVVGAAACWSDGLGRKDKDKGVSNRRRKLRGWGVAAVVLPVTLLAVIEAVPAGQTLMALFAGS